MKGITSACVIRLARDPEDLRFTGVGTPFLALSGAVVDDRKDDGQTTWLRVTAWNAAAEQLAARGLRKGDQVYCEGRLELREYVKDGTPRQGLSMSAWVVQPMGAIGRRTPKPATGNGGGAPVSATPDVPARRSPGGGAWATAQAATVADRSRLV